MNLPVEKEHTEEEDEMEYALRDAKGISVKPLTKEELHESTLQVRSPCPSTPFLAVHCSCHSAL